MRWSLRTLLFAFATTAAYFGVFRGFGESGRLNQQLLLAIYLLLVTTTAVTALPMGATLRGRLFGASIFGVVYFVCILKGGFGVENIYDSQRLVSNTLLGFALLGLSFLTSQFLSMFMWPSQRRHDRDDRRSSR